MRRRMACADPQVVEVFRLNTSEFELKESSRQRKSFMTCLLNVILVVVVGAVTFFIVPMAAQVIRVQGDSMAPTLQSGQLVLVNRLAYQVGAVKHGDVVVFKSPENSGIVLIKRIIALPGERISINRGIISVNDERLAELYVTEPGLTQSGPMTMKDGTVFVLGDHRLVSNDSRDWGALPVEYIIGRVEFSIWPPEPVS